MNIHEKRNKDGLCETQKLGAPVAAGGSRADEDELRVNEGAPGTMAPSIRTPG